MAVPKRKTPRAKTRAASSFQLEAGRARAFDVSATAGP